MIGKKIRFDHLQHKNQNCDNHINRVLLHFKILSS